MPLEGPNFPEVEEKSVQSSRDKLLLFNGLAAFVLATLGAAIAELCVYKISWGTRSVLGPSNGSSVPYTLRDLASQHVLQSSGVIWTIAVGAAALTCGGVLALVAGRRQALRVSSGVAMVTGAILIGLARLFVPALPSIHEIAGGDFILWTSGKAQNLGFVMIFFGGACFTQTHLAYRHVSTTTRPGARI
jgi:hypothetical protein